MHASEYPFERITPGFAHKAFQITKLKPARNGYYHAGYSGADAIGAICIMLGTGIVIGVEHNVEREIHNMAELLWGEEYVRGFSRGFDGESDIGISDLSTEAGYNDGKAVWDFLQVEEDELIG